ncbi:MAG: galactokinase [bacterium]|nr:galactokinase [bacterium]
MIITRTPFRITLGGGGTDLPSYYTQYGGFVFSAAINKYMFINLNRPVVDDLVRVKYTKSETVKHRDDLQHEIAKGALRMLGIERAIEIISSADIPDGTGLGSSSCYAVGLLNAIHALKRDYISLPELAEEACYLEIELLKKPIGKQDQYIATFGGLTAFEIAKDGRVTVIRADVSSSVLDDLKRNLLIFYTGVSRQSMDILSEQNKGAQTNKKTVLESLHYIKESGYRIKELIESGNLTDFGLMMDKHWEYKKKMSSKISNPEFDRIYEVAKECGVLGGKITGAGGGGFFLFYIEKGHERLRTAMHMMGLREMRFNFEFEGSKVLVNLMNSEDEGQSRYVWTPSRLERMAVIHAV